MTPLVSSSFVAGKSIELFQTNIFPRFRPNLTSLLKTLAYHAPGGVAQKHRLREQKLRHTVTIRASWERNDGFAAYRDLRNYLSHPSSPHLPEPLRKDMYAEFSMFSKAEKESLYHLLVQVSKALHQNIAV
ncbi:uncharacterized protein LOC110032353 [Phalaenopsis equestris]|uniref:uncharacterized protein LOC110032353 n=1 Tax=Phalaenopsis equestris TaxID=78828 RepID=UPI0009E23B88|nr:uncharacterized protein LOC110032353 [Phalaenopsis equestris]